MRAAGRSPAHATGLLATLAASLPAAFVAVWESDARAPTVASSIAIGIASLLLAWAALRVDRHPREAKGALTLATIAFLVSVAPSLIESPLATFSFGVLAAMVLASAVTGDGTATYEIRLWRLGDVRGALIPLVATWVAVGPGELAHGPIARGAALATASVALLLTARALWSGVLLKGIRAIGAWLVLAGAALGGAANLEDPATALLIATAPLLVVIALVRADDLVADADLGRSWDSILTHPARLLVVTFLAVVAVGTLVLWLPAASHPPSRLHPIDALFTATSATCVTGLIVVDTPTAFGGFGQAAILVLIQIGGLGIMAFSTAALVLLRRRASLRHERAVIDLLGAEGRASLSRSVRHLFIVTLVSEGVGAVVLTLLFARSDESWLSAAWRGLFTSISAFCNAGFALQTESLIPYQTDPLLLHVVGLLVIVGGIGPAVIVLLPDFVRRRPVPVHVRLVVVTTILLLVIPAFLIGAIEWSDALGHLSFWDRINNAWFQSVTLRTAGFNSVEFGALRPATMIVMMALMFVGGSPGSTAGGVKTTTVAIMGLSVLAAIRGQPDAIVAGRRIGQSTVYKSAAIITLGALSALGLVLVLLLTQNIAPMSVLFEAVSALGTVGLSVGATGQLDDVGKIAVAIAMFAGRVGPLTLFLLLLERRHEGTWTLPKEESPVG